MEKISRIIPPSARTKTYDVSRAQPARPGSPQLGRPEVMMDRVSLSDQLLEPMLSGETIPAGKSPELYKPKENFKADIVKEMTNKFFVNSGNAKDTVRDTDTTHSEETTKRAQTTPARSPASEV